jgi:hypothetical protein
VPDAFRLLATMPVAPNDIKDDQSGNRCGCPEDNGITQAAPPRSDCRKVRVTDVLSVPIHTSSKSAFRRCGRDLVEFFDGTGWAFLVNLTPNSPSCGLLVIRL